mgnify:FL=1
MPSNQNRWAAIELNRREQRIVTAEDQREFNEDVRRAQSDRGFRARLAQIAQHGRYASGIHVPAQLAAAGLSMLAPPVGIPALLGAMTYGGLNVAEGWKRRQEGIPGAGTQMLFGGIDVLPFGVSKAVRGLKGGAKTVKDAEKYIPAFRRRVGEKTAEIDPKTGEPTGKVLQDPKTLRMGSYRAARGTEPHGGYGPQEGYDISIPFGSILRELQGVRLPLQDPDVYKYGKEFTELPGTLRPSDILDEAGRRTDVGREAGVTLRSVFDPNTGKMGPSEALSGESATYGRGGLPDIRFEGEGTAGLGKTLLGGVRQTEATIAKLARERAHRAMDELQQRAAREGDVSPFAHIQEQTGAQNRYSNAEINQFQKMEDGKLVSMTRAEIDELELASKTEQQFNQLLRDRLREAQGLQRERLALGLRIPGAPRRGGPPSSSEVPFRTPSGPSKSATPKQPVTPEQPVPPEQPVTSGPSVVEQATEAVEDINRTADLPPKLPSHQGKAVQEVAEEIDKTPIRGLDPYFESPGVSKEFLGATEGERAAFEWFLPQWKKETQLFLDEMRGPLMALKLKEGATTAGRQQMLTGQIPGMSGTPGTYLSEGSQRDLLRSLQEGQGTFTSPLYMSVGRDAGARAGGKPGKFGFRTAPDPDDPTKVLQREAVIDKKTGEVKEPARNVLEGVTQITAKATDVKTGASLDGLLGAATKSEKKLAQKDLNDLYFGRIESLEGYIEGSWFKKLAFSTRKNQQGNLVVLQKKMTDAQKRGWKKAQLKLIYARRAQLVNKIMTRGSLPKDRISYGVTKGKESLTRAYTSEVKTFLNEGVETQRDVMLESSIDWVQTLTSFLALLMGAETLALAGVPNAANR